jgi:hypothetical protein
MGIGSQRQAPADLPPEKRHSTYYTGGYVGPTATYFQTVSQKSCLFSSDSLS